MIDMMTIETDKKGIRDKSSFKFRKYDQKRLKKAFLLAIFVHIIILYAVFPDATPNRISMEQKNLMKISMLPKKEIKRHQKKKRKKSR